MLKNIKLNAFLMLVAVALLAGCKKEEYSFGDIKTPTNLAIEAVIEGVDAGNPNGNGTGNVAITASSENAITYKINFGDNDSLMTSSGNITHKYRTPGINTYTITVNAIGTAGVISTITKTVTVFVLFNIPNDILQALCNGSSRVWITDKDAMGHFGVGPSAGFYPIWYEAPPNTREACAYDDEITFAKDALNRVTMTVNNMGQSFSIGASAAFYGQSGGDACYGINAGGAKMLTFMNATSGSTAAQSTQIQFSVPGNGIINFGTGGVIYEIIAINNDQMFIRNIGSDGNAWYQRLKPKP
ncbi:MAG TPA: PKD domain-containing protein [Ferruginibacter sp.]|nr:PKD domain-containing protein [Ferruginibacter sp.]